jgi:hypothetical protein
MLNICLFEGMAMSQGSPKSLLHATYLKKVFPGSLKGVKENPLYMPWTEINE